MDPNRTDARVYREPTLINPIDPPSGTFEEPGVDVGGSIFSRALSVLLQQRYRGTPFYSHPIFCRERSPPGSRRTHKDQAR